MKSKNHKLSPDPLTRKSKNISNMFDRIAPSYDFLNHLLSFSQDKRWRKKALANFNKEHFDLVLDMATGTGDFGLECLRLSKKIDLKARVIGTDFSLNMLRQHSGRNKFTNFKNGYETVQSDIQYLPFPNEIFSGITIAFGIRNVENIKKALKEAIRVIKPGGRLLVLEFSIPRNKLFNKIYKFYFNKILPTIGNLISGDKGAYDYLPESVSHFPSKEEFTRWLRDVGFENVRFKDYTFGITTLYIADT